MSVQIGLVVAAARNGVIGRGNDLPWKLPGDLRQFKALTTGGVVICGRRTYDSIVRRLGRPLPGRFMVVVSSRLCMPCEGVIFVSSVEVAMEVGKSIATYAGQECVYVIGGRSVYEQALPLVDRVFLTEVQAEVEGDTVMPEGWLGGFRFQSACATAQGSGDQYSYSFLTYVRR